MKADLWMWLEVITGSALLLAAIILAVWGLVVLGASLPDPSPDPCRPALLARPTGATSIVCPDARQRIRMVEGEITCACEEVKR